MKNAGEHMRKRACLLEHPFRTLKCRAGYRHFLVRGFDKVRGEWGLMALCYNFSRVLTIMGIQKFIEYLAKKTASVLLFVPSFYLFLTSLRPPGRARGAVATPCSQL